jgi:iron complex outermembrane receptor protein
MPSNSFSALVTHRLNADWDASLAYYQVGRTTQLGDGDPVDLIRKSDFRVARKFKQGNVGGEMSLVVENLFNDHYLEFADYNAAKRRARFNLRLDF